MPVAVQRGDRPQALLQRVVRHQLHAVGVIVSTVPKAVTKVLDQVWDDPVALDASPRFAPGTPARKRLDFAKTVRATLRSAQAHGGLCVDAVSDAFAQRAMANRIHDDAELAVGLSYGPGHGQGQGQQQGHAYRVSGVASWATADNADALVASDADVPRQLTTAAERAADKEIDVRVVYTVRPAGRQGAALARPDAADPINALVQEGRAAELDLVCAANPSGAGGRATSQHTAHVPGSGRGVLLHALTRIAAAGRGGKFRAVVAYAAKNAAGRYPLANTLLQLGFRRMDCFWTRRMPNGEERTRRSERAYYVLQDDEEVGGARWPELLLRALDWDGTAADGLCPLRPRPSPRMLCA